MQRYVNQNITRILSYFLSTLPEMLINADDYIATKKEICQRLWTINEKDVNNRYNALTWRLRESLAQINGIELLTIKDTALQLVFTKKKGKEQAG